MRPDQLGLLTSVSAPAVHPDGTWAVVATSRPDFGVDDYVGQLVRVELDGSGTRRLTRGRHDSTPRFSPDGTLLAFLRAGVNERPQLHLLPLQGGEAMCITDQPLGVSDFAFSPDGTRVAFIARVPADGRYGTLDGVDAGHEDPRRISSLRFQANGLGWLRDRCAQVFVVDVPDVFAEPVFPPVGRAAADSESDKPSSVGIPTARQLTTDPVDHEHPVFSDDGTAVLVAAARPDGRETLITDLVSVSVDGTGAARLTSGSVQAASPSVAAGRVWFAGVELGDSGVDFVGSQPGVYVIEDGAPRRLTDQEVYVEGELTATTDGVLAIAGHRGVSHLLRLGAETTEVLLDADAHAVVTGAAAAPARPGAAEVIVVSYRTGASMGEVGVVSDGAIKPLTDFSAALREATTVRQPAEITAKAPDGYPVHGWVVLPDRDGPHPVLLMIHGGPFAAYTPAYFDEAQTYAEAGYAVVMCNPRGSAGYGPDHGRAIKGDFGNLDKADVLAFLDHALATVPGLDPERVGIMGGSYGGYLTAWIIAHHHRWAGAIVERGYLDPASFVGASDIGWVFPQQYNGASLEQLNAQSPTLLVDRVTTPTLVMHSEQDLRCPLSQALRYYTLLKQHGVPTELLVFPAENHELSRSGTPWHRRQRLEAILDWWGRHLPVTG